MKIVFQAHKGTALLSRAIRLLSPKYNHISIRVENEVFEAHIKHGVTKTPYKTWKGKSSVVAKKSLELDTITGLKVVSFLNKQVGKKYDLWSVIGFVWVFMKPRNGFWMCSELAIVALGKCLGRRDVFDNQKVSPDLFWRILNTFV